MISITKPESIWQHVTRTDPLLDGEIKDRQHGGGDKSLKKGRSFVAD